MIHLHVQEQVLSVMAHRAYSIYRLEEKPSLAGALVARASVDLS